MYIMREVEKMLCGCGGNYKEVATTEQERKEWGCHRDSDKYSCCVMAVKCDGCDNRIVLALASPDYG